MIGVKIGLYDATTLAYVGYWVCVEDGDPEGLWEYHSL